MKKLSMEESMSTVKLSPKYQIVIPQEVRQCWKYRPGQLFQVFDDDGQIILVPVRPMREMRGFLKGMNTDGLRDEEDRL